MKYKDYDGVVQDSFQAFLVQGADFTQLEEYPILRRDMVPEAPPTKVVSFSEAITSRKDLSDCVICFYSPDPTFERVRRNPKKYLSFFKCCKGIIGFDFSVHTDMPIAKQISQMNDNLSLSFYFANNGVSLYPNCRGGSDDLDEEYLSAFPKNTYIALGVHGFIKRREQKHEWRRWIRKVVDKLEPKGFIVVGHLPKTIIDEFSGKAEFHEFDSFIERRRKELMSRVD